MENFWNISFGSFLFYVKLLKVQHKCFLYENTYAILLTRMWDSGY